MCLYNTFVHKEFTLYSGMDKLQFTAGQGFLVPCCTEKELLGNHTTKNTNDKLNIKHYDEANAFYIHKTRGSLRIIKLI